MSLPPLRRNKATWRWQEPLRTQSGFGHEMFISIFGSFLINVGELDLGARAACVFSLRLVLVVVFLFLLCQTEISSLT